MHRCTHSLLARSFLLLIKFLLVMLSLLLSLQLAADPVRVAVASNFVRTMQEIRQQFEQQSNHHIELISGSTGKIHAQILHGAPFDVFFAADSRRPALLEEAGMIQPNSRFSYALGQLVLWSPVPGFVDNQGKVLQNGDFHHIAIANPKLAPYGQAARQVMKSLGIWDHCQKKLVRGENIGQTFQFVESGNAELGFLALSQLKTASTEQSGSYWLVPAELYDPVEQQAVQLTESHAATALMDFVRSDRVREIIQRHGYLLP